MACSHGNPPEKAQSYSAIEPAVAPAASPVSKCHVPGKNQRTERPAVKGGPPGAGGQ